MTAARQRKLSHETPDSRSLSSLCQSLTLSSCGGAWRKRLGNERIHETPLAHNDCFIENDTEICSIEAGSAVLALALVILNEYYRFVASSLADNHAHKPRHIVVSIWLSCKLSQNVRSASHRPCVHDFFSSFPSLCSSPTMACATFDSQIGHRYGGCRTSSFIPPVLCMLHA
jgi:hypothetical protein